MTNKPAKNAANFAWSAKALNFSIAEIAVKAKALLRQLRARPVLRLRRHLRPHRNLAIPSHRTTTFPFDFFNPQ